MSLRRVDRLHRIARPILFGVMVLYGCATILVPLADSVLETAAHETVEHFEKVSPPCGFGHDQLTCPLCQFISLPSIAHDISCQLDFEQSQLPSNAVARSLPRVTRLFSPLGPRGPPPA